MQGFGHINIAQAGHDPLIEQKRFQVTAFALGFSGKVRSAQFVAERLNAEVCEQRVGRPFSDRAQHHKAKPAGVVVDNACAIREREHDVVMFGICAGIVDIVAKRDGLRAVFNREAAAHSQVHDQDGAVAKRDDEVFCATADGCDGSTHQTGWEIFGKREAKVCAALIDPNQALAQHDGFQSTADDFDFGEFGHSGAALGAARSGYRPNPFGEMAFPKPLSFFGTTEVGATALNTAMFRR